ncbi:MAG: lactate utilization protein LutB domain-containing protein [Lysinibacillus sp.]
MKPFTNEDKITGGPSLLKNWTQIRDLPSPAKQRFRDWYKQHQGEGEKE